MTNIVNFSENLTIIKNLLGIKNPDFEEECAGIEVETDTHYLYAYDWFDGQTFEYTFCRKENKEYIKVELSVSEVEYIKNVLWETYEENKEDEILEPESSWNSELDLNPHFTNYLTGY